MASVGELAGDDQARYGCSAAQVLMNNFGHVCRSHATIKRAVRKNEYCRPTTLARTEATGARQLIGARLRFFPQLIDEFLVDQAASASLARAVGVSQRTILDADEDALEWHVDR